MCLLCSMLLFYARIHLPYTKPVNLFLLHLDKNQRRDGRVEQGQQVYWIDAKLCVRARATTEVLLLISLFRENTQKSE